MVEEKNASLSTLSVTIQALVVSGKQMTLSVFRQVKETNTVWDGSTPWGWVRYPMESDSNHGQKKYKWWLVMSHEGQLWRMCEPDGDIEYKKWDDIDGPQLFIAV